MCWASIEKQSSQSGIRVFINFVEKNYVRSSRTVSQWRFTLRELNFQHSPESWLRMPYFGFVTMRQDIILRLYFICNFSNAFYYFVLISILHLILLYNGLYTARNSIYLLLLLGHLTSYLTGHALWQVPVSTKSKHKQIESFWLQKSWFKFFALKLF